MQRATPRQQDLDDLPGSVHDAEPGHALLEAHRGGASRIATTDRSAGPQRSARRSARLAEVGITRPGSGGSLPVPALGRHAAAGRARGRARGRPGAPDRRRAVDGARRDDPGRDPRAPEVGAAGARDGADPDHARPPGRVLGRATASTSSTRARSSRSSDADALEREPLHPYSLGLLLSEPATEFRQQAASGDRRLGPAPGRRRRPVQLRAALPLGETACAAATPPPLRRGGAGPVVGLPAARRDPRRDGRRSRNEVRAVAEPTEAAERADVPFVVICRPPQGLRRTRRHRRHSPTSRSSVGRSESVGIVGESGLGKDDARALPRRARDTDRRARIDARRGRRE